MLFNAALPLALLCAAPPASSLSKNPQEPSPTMPIAQLAPSYKAFRFKVAGSQGGLTDILSNPMMMVFGMMGAMGGQNDAPPFELFSAMDIYWTRGEMFSAFGQPFLVTYKLDFSFTDLMKSQGKPDLTKSPLRLHLVRTDALQTVAPLLDLTPEAYAQMLKLPDMPKAPAKTEEEDEDDE